LTSTTSSRSERRRRGEKKERVGERGEERATRRDAFGGWGGTVTHHGAPSNLHACARLQRGFAGTVAVDIIVLAWRVAFPFQ